MTDDTPQDSHAAASPHGGLFPQAAGPVPDFLSTPLDVRLRRASPEAPDPTDAVAGAEVSPAEEESASVREAEWQEPPSAETHVPKDGDGSAAEVDADFTASGPDQPPSQSIPAATNHAPPVEGTSTDAEAAPHDDRHRALSDAGTHALGWYPRAHLSSRESDTGPGGADRTARRKAARLRRPLNMPLRKDTFPSARGCARVQNLYETRHQVGLWRSLVARPSGGRKVAGSSPASPTKYLPIPPASVRYAASRAAMTKGER